jgi:hypothetical protein
MAPITYNTFSYDEMETIASPLKIGVLATVNSDGQPHLSLISTLQACGMRKMVWGQFTEGLSKQYICQNPRAGFLIMSLDKDIWRGKASFTHSATSGPEFDMYNDIPMFRYNAYFGIHTVYYMDLVEHTGRQALKMNAVVRAAMETMLVRTLSRGRGQKPAMNAWTQAFLNKLDHLKFLAYVGADGYPVVLPVIQAQAAGTGRIVYSVSAYRDELAGIPCGASVALFAMSLKMQDVLVRGIYRGVRRVGLLSLGILDVDWVYNSMPPKPEQIYPALLLSPVINEW